jgi:acetoin utilization deacetylase AcuC-like enzyme
LGSVVEESYTQRKESGGRQCRGFCIFGNVAVAAMKLIAEKGARRIAVVDCHVHHGNGTQSAFYDRSGVLTISIH